MIYLLCFVLNLLTKQTHEIWVLNLFSSDEPMHSNSLEKAFAIHQYIVIEQIKVSKVHFTYGNIDYLCFDV